MNAVSFGNEGLHAGSFLLGHPALLLVMRRGQLPLKCPDTPWFLFIPPPADLKLQASFEAIMPAPRL